MASQGRVKRERDPRSVVLALEAPKTTSFNDAASGSRFIPNIIIVHSGEDILEKIQSYLECHNIRSNFQTPYLNGHILSAHGEVSNPTLLRQGLPVVFEGTYAIGSLSGWYKVPRNGPVELDNLKIAFYGTHGQGIGGDVTGSLVAATEVVQVMVSWINYVDED